MPTPTGTPAGVDSMYTSAAQIIDSTRIDWPALLGGQFTPDYTTSPPCLDARQTSGGFPVGLCNGNASLNGRRYGLLVVTGNVTLENGVHWDGILVVGGNVDANRANVVVHGMMITGLNGPSVAPSQLQRGNTFQWASCYNGPSVATLSGLVPIKNAWVDNWSTY
jgi:formylmethanofuran dehydrogenase subunit C